MLGHVAQAGHGDRAVVGVQRGQQPDQQGERVGRGAAVHAGVQRVVQRAHLDHGLHEAAQRGRERRGADGRVGGVGDDEHVGAQALAVLGEEGLERRRADLLLALDEHGDADAGAVRVGGEVGAHGGQVGADAGLVVGGAAAEEPAVALGGDEGVARPVRRLAGRLDVVVGVEQDGRGARGRGPPGDHRGGAGRAVRARRAEQLDLGQAGLAQQPGDLVGGAPDVLLVERGGAHARHGHERPELLDDLGHEAGDGLAGGVDVTACGTGGGRGSLGTGRP